MNVFNFLKKVSAFLLESFFITGFIKRDMITKIIFNFRRIGLERLTFCNKFNENRWIGFVDMSMCIFLIV